MSTAVSPRRLLLVEDSSTMRRMISTLLGDEGYVVETAVDGVDGLAKARAKVPELILTDYEMPEMDGPGLCRALKEDPILHTTPVIMLTTLGAKISAHPFQHGSIYEIGKFKLVSSYHCSRYNTNTRRLTTEMFEDVVSKAKALALGAQ